jgi:hypothetical protein
MICNIYDYQELYYPYKIINNCWDDTSRHLARALLPKSMAFNSTPFAWDVDLATRENTVGNATMCVSMIKLDYMKREDLLLNLKLDAYRFD